MISKKIQWVCLGILLWACNNEKSQQDHAAHHTASSFNSNYSDSVNNGLIAKDTLKGSPHRTAMSTINGNHVHIEYNSPGVKDRVIWGGLVAYDKVWATGAHNATTIQFNKAILIDGKTIPAGKYAFFTIPGKDKWVIILNTRHEQHLADDYNESEDVIRVNAKAESHEMTQRLTFAVKKTTETTGEISMQWEKIAVSLPFESK